MTNKEDKPETSQLSIDSDDDEFYICCNEKIEYPDEC